MGTETNATAQGAGRGGMTARVGAAALPLGILVLLVSEVFHPQREDPTNHPAVFAEYAASETWTTVHLFQYFGFLLVMGGLVSLYYALGAGRGTGLAPFGLAAAVVAAASYTVLQAVDGITLKRAVDSWVAAPPEGQSAAFAAAEAVRWAEVGMNSFSNFLSGLAIFLYGAAIALGTAFPRWVGWMALVIGGVFMYHGAVVVAYEGFVASDSKLVGIALLAVWACVMAVLMWRGGGREGSPAAAPRWP